MHKTAKNKLKRLFRDLSHPSQAWLIEILAGKTSISSSGYPYISERSFQIFLSHVPHLFKDGDRLLTWLEAAERKVEGSVGLPIAQLSSVRRAVKVLKTVVQTAAVCAPADLWFLRHILSAHVQTGVRDRLVSGGWIDQAELLSLGQDEYQLHIDLSFLISRGYIASEPVKSARPRFRIPPRATQVLLHWKRTAPLPKDWEGDWSEKLAVSLGKGSEEFLAPPLKNRARHPARMGWAPTEWETEIGFRLVPSLLALHQLGVLKGAKKGMQWNELAPKCERFATLLVAAGILNASKRITGLGERVCQRAVGPFGIIHAYYPYADRLVDFLKAKRRKNVWVDRGKNVAASQSANRKTFEMANQSIDRFCRDHGFSFDVFIEHALGQGEATRQRYEAEKGRDIKFFGADLEDAAVDRAILAQKAGQLPPSMRFIRGADIGKPEIVLRVLRESGASSQGAVMVVGNGFHEVRGQNDKDIVQVFKGYCDAGIILVFTEESELSDKDLLATAWNTYHAGFRYTHLISGQGLRSSAAVGMGGRLGWPSCVEKAGYVLLKKYSDRTRTVYPHALKGQSNPPISMNYFCVPADILKNLKR